MGSPQQARSPFPGQWMGSSPPAPKAPPHSLVPSWFQTHELACSEQVRYVLLHSRKDSTRKTYLQKWKRFALWCSRNHLMPNMVTLPNILDYLLKLKQDGLSLSSIKVHLTAIITFHDLLEGYSLFTHPTIKRFLMSLQNLCAEIYPTWNLNLILHALVKPPF